MVYTLRFFLQNAVCFIILTYLVHILHTGCAKIKKNNSGAKRLMNKNITQKKNSVYSHVGIRSKFSVAFRCRNVPVWSFLSGSMRMPLQLGATDPTTATTLCPMSDSNYSTFRSKRWRSNGHDGASTGTRGVSWHPEIVGSSGGRSNRVQTWIWSDIYDATQKRVFVQVFPRIDIA